MTAPHESITQTDTINLEKAIAIGVNNYPSLKKDQLFIRQQEELGNAAGWQPRANVYFRGEEMNFQDDLGVQAIGISQQFRLGGAVKAERGVREAMAGLGQAQLNLSAAALKQQL